MKYIFLCLCSFCLFFSSAIFADNNQPIDLNFAHVPVRDVLQILAQFNHLNLVVSDQVKGDITLHLQQVPWQQALTIILQSQGLISQQEGNVLLIAPAEAMAKHQEQLLQAELAQENVEPLQSVLIQLHYAKAADIASLLKNKNNSLLSARGEVSVDARTNTLWVEDDPEQLAQIQTLVQKLDVPVKEVLIEARIVNVDEKYEQELGIRFGVTSPGSNLTGTLNGANQLAQGASPASINPLDRLNVDLPSAGAGAAGGAATLGIALAKLGSGTLLDLELSALESEGGGEIISSPRLMTANQQPATILSGQEIPYQESTSSGATSVSFKKAVLSLSVTPQITANNKLILNLQVNQDRPGTVLVQGVPVIETRQIQTQVLVGDGQTIVLGGIYERSQQNQVERVPFLGKLPVIGVLFRHTYKKRDRKELLIFITPKIVTG